MKSKKILLVLFIALVVIISSANFVYADSVNVNAKASTEDYAEGQTVIITVSLSDINSSKGIYGLEGKLDYKTDIFEEIKSDEDGVTEQITGLNDWGDITYNSETREFSIVKTSPIKDTEDIMQISLKVKQGAPLGKAIIMLDDLVASNGTDDIDTAPVTVTVNIKDKSEVGGGTILPITSPSPVTTSSPISITLSTPTTSPDKLPQTGIGDNPTPVLLGTLIISLVSFIAYRRYKDI